MDDQREQAKCASAALGCLVDLACAAFAASGGPETKVDVDDIEQLVEVLHVLRRENADFEFFDGWLHMLRHDWAEAESVYRSLIGRSLCLPASKGMLLQCVKAREPFGWQEDARKLVDEYGNHEVARLAKTLLANDDLQQAYETARRTGTFVPPESTRELEQNAAAEGAWAAAPRALNAHDMLQYIRI
jgi:type III secretion protein HrpB1